MVVCIAKYGACLNTVGWLEERLYSQSDVLALESYSLEIVLRNFVGYLCAHGLTRGL